MMYPEHLEPEKDKNFWEDQDCFYHHPFHYVRAFLHQNYQIGMHSHSFYELNLVTHGTGCHYIEGMKFPVKPGDFFVIPPDILHGYCCQAHLNVYHILIKNEFFVRYRQELEGLKGYKVLFEIEPYLRQTVDESYFLHLDFQDLNSVIQEAEKLQEAYKKQEFSLLNIKALSFLCMLCEKIREQLNDTRLRTNQELIPVLEYIRNHLEQKLTLEDLAKQASMSKATLNRRFQQLLHVSPMSYIQQCRVEQARSLLGQFSKTEIAQMCGFYDSSHMEKYLKMHPPSEK